MTELRYPKRLIEVDLPIKRISAHARREKSIRHGHISTLHIWWARRPLAACRAVICASLWPDPADELCPQSFRDKALALMKAFADKAVSGPDIANHCHPESMGKYYAIAGRTRPAAGTGKAKEHLPTPELNATDPAHLNILRYLLLDFIADFANWDNSTVKAYLDTSRALTQAAHEALGGQPGTRPLVVDPFAGGGSIPLEALRVGADAFASDLNPVAVLLNVVVETLAVDDCLIRQYRELAQRIRERLAGVWPPQVFARFWARTIRCEGPSCGVEIPLIRDGLISRRTGVCITFSRSSAGRARVEERPEARTSRPITAVVAGEASAPASTCRNGSVTCPVCNFTHTQSGVARQAMRSGFGLRLVGIGEGQAHSRSYRSPNLEEEQLAVDVVSEQSNHLAECLSVPINPLRPSPAARGMSAVTRYGYTQYRHLFSRQQLDIMEMIRQCIDDQVSSVDPAVAPALHILLSITLDRLAAFQNLFCRWAPKGEHPVPPFGKNGFPMIWDYVEANPFGDSAGSWDGAVTWVVRVLQHLAVSRGREGTVQRSDSRAQVLPEDAADAWITDPPYYDSYPYADLSDFFHPIMRASLAGKRYTVSRLFDEAMAPKDEEIVLQPSRLTATGPKTHEAYRAGMTSAFATGRLTTRPDGVGVIVFANKTTGGWEALISSVCAAGWIVTASWPIDTERESRGGGQARLQSSVHLVCRPRENQDGSVDSEKVGDWRTVLGDLPTKIHEWMPRLAREGVVGADAIFACLGPALEIFSRYSRVEKASGDPVPLREYLEQVWAVVAREAMTMVFEGTDAGGLEEDGRITAMWLWTLSSERNGEREAKAAAQDEDESGEEESNSRPKRPPGFWLEYDAARKIAQGLGVHLERLESVVDIRGEMARLIPVSERASYLFETERQTEPSRRARQPKQLTLDGMEPPEPEPESQAALLGLKSAQTTMDRVHQSMLLFSAGRSEALVRFLVEDGIGRDAGFWKLAQALSYLYPPSSEEKRWVDGVLARKKGLGF